MKSNTEDNPSAIIIPAHNEQSCLRGLLESIRLYGPSNPQVIVVDNGSTDDTASIATAFGTTLVKTSGRLYPSQARNNNGRRIIFGVTFHCSLCFVFYNLHSLLSKVPEFANMSVSFPG